MDTETLIRRTFSNPPSGMLRDVIEVKLGEAHVEYDSRTIMVDGQPRLMGMIATVCTDPAFQGLGLASGLIRSIHRMANFGPIFMGLFSDSPRFYERLGYFNAPNLGEYGMVFEMVPTQQRWNLNAEVDLRGPKW